MIKLTNKEKLHTHVENSSEIQMPKPTREENSYPFRKPNGFRPVRYWLHSLTASPSEQTQNSK